MVNLHHVWFQNTVEEKILSRYRVSIKNLRSPERSAILHSVYILVVVTGCGQWRYHSETAELKKKRFPCSVLTQSFSTSCDI